MENLRTNIAAEVLLNQKNYILKDKKRPSD
jgi:hypothetical protein